MGEFGEWIKIRLFDIDSKFSSLDNPKSLKNFSLYQKYVAKLL